MHNYRSDLFTSEPKYQTTHPIDHQLRCSSRSMVAYM